MPVAKAVLLDVDGTMIDSNDAHARSWVDAIATEGIQVDYSRVRPLIGMGGDRLLPAVTGLEEDSAQGKKISERRKKIFREKYLPGIRAFPGVRELLQRMRERGLKLVVATSSGRDLLDDLLERAGVKDLIEGTTDKDSVDSSKPAPDIVEAALKEAGVRKDEAVMLGDSPYDVEAAARAGVRIVALLCGGFAEQELEGAQAVYDDPGDLLENFDSSPFASSHAPSRDLEARV